MSIETLYDLANVEKLHDGATEHTVRGWVRKKWLRPTAIIGGKLFFSEEAIRAFRFDMTRRSSENLRKRAARFRAQAESPSAKPGEEPNG